MTNKLKLYVTAVVLAGLAVTVYGSFDYPGAGSLSSVAFFLVVAGASTVKVKLPGTMGTYSLSFLVILIGFAGLSLGPLLMAGWVAAIVQSLWRARHKPTWYQVAFNGANLALSIGGSNAVYHLLAPDRVPAFAVASAVYFAINTLGVSIVLCLAEDKPLAEMWDYWVLWSFPLYLVGSALAGAFSTTSYGPPWMASLCALPLMYLGYLCYSALRRAMSRGHLAAWSARAAVQPHD